MSKFKNLVLCSIGVLILGSVFGYGKVVGITQITAHKSLDAVCQGIMDVLKVERPEDRIIFANANGDISTAVQIGQKFASDGVDVIVGISTPSAQSVMKLAKEKEIPLVFASVTDPVGAKLVSNLEKPGGNITGTRNSSPIGREFELIRRVLPKARNIGIVINYGEDNNIVLLKECERVGKEMGFKIVTSPVDNSSGVSAATNYLVDKVDVIFLLQDNMVASALPALLKVAAEHRIPVVSVFLEAVRQGALMGLAYDEYEIGRQTGKMVVRILKGEKAGDIAVEDPAKLEFGVNEKVANSLGVEIDLEVYLEFR